MVRESGRIGLERQIEGAKDHIEHLIAWGFLKRGPDWITAFPKYGLQVSDEHGCLMIRRSLSIPLFKPRGRTETSSILRCTSPRHVCKHGAEMPEPLIQLVSEYLNGEFSRPAGRRGRSKNWGRDSIIVEAMCRLIEENELSATCRHDLKGVRKRRVSASEIVFEALKRTELGHIDLQRIHGIWNSMNDHPDYDKARGSYIWSYMFEDWDGLNRDDWV